MIGAPVYADRGEQGRIWRLETRGGAWAVKELLLPVAEADAVMDVRFQLGASAAGIPLPLPRPARDGRIVQVVTGTEIGAVTARLHQVPQAEARPAEAWFSEPVGEPAWQVLLDDARRGDASWAGELGRRLPDLIALDALVTAPDEARLRTCHRDVITENVRRGAGGGVIVLDWENSGPAQPERELAAILCDLAVDVAPAAARDGYAAYRAAGGPARLTGAADFGMAAVVQGHLLQFYSRRALDQAESAENRARSRKRMDQILRQPVTMARIDRLLDLITR
ncbi:MAG TPA: aminoglycoside phosphotransferase family protein [Streptosporangiaceae bacterium]